MTVRTRTVYRCTECGTDYLKWGGRCDACGEWNTLVEEVETVPTRSRASGRPRSEATATRPVPISDVDSHHRTMTSCHLCNIALMLGRDLKWDPDKQQFDGDEQATMLMTRPRREKYSWESTT